MRDGERQKNTLSELIFDEFHLEGNQHEFPLAAGNGWKSISQSL